MEAPFYIGQKVVALKSVSNGVGYSIKKGQIYTVEKCFKCKCDEWKVDVGIQSYPGSPCSCKICSNIVGVGAVICVAALFAPIEENKERIRYVAVSETLREKAQEIVIETAVTN